MCLEKRGEERRPKARRGHVRRKECRLIVHGVRTRSLEVHSQPADLPTSACIAHCTVHGIRPSSLLLASRLPSALLEDLAQAVFRIIILGAFTIHRLHRQGPKQRRNSWRRCSTLCQAGITSRLRMRQRRKIASVRWRDVPSLFLRKVVSEYRPR